MIGEDQKKYKDQKTRERPKAKVTVDQSKVDPALVFSAIKLTDAIDKLGLGHLMVINITSSL